MAEVTRLRHLKESARDQLMIDPRIIKIEEGHNPRDYRLKENRDHLNSLKASIKERGTLIPLLVRYDADLRAAVLVDGECRLRANLELIEEGVEIVAVPTIQVTAQKDQKEDTYLFDALIANTGKPLSQWESGNAYKRLYNHGHSEESIAKRIGISVQAVKRAMELSDAPDEVKHLLSEQAVTPAFALSEIRKSRTGAVMVLRTASDNAKKSGKKGPAKKAKAKGGTLITLQTLVRSIVKDLDKGIDTVDDTEFEWVEVKRLKLKKLIELVGAR